MAITLRDALLPVLSHLRAIPGRLGMRPYRVILVTTTWTGGTGGNVGDGTKTTVRRNVTESGQPPKVRWLTNEEITLAGYSRPTIEVGPITPNHPRGGTSLATLKAKAATGEVEFYYELTGPDFPTGAKFVLVEDMSDRALRYTVRLQRTGDGT